MGTLSDEILRATGGPTVNDGLLAFYIARGASADSTLNDAARQWLIIQSGVPDPENYTDNDLWSLIPGLTGTLNDRQLQYWTAQP